MGSCNEGKTIVMVERLGDILTKGVARTSRRYAPATPVIWVGPKQITHWALMGHLLYAVERPNVIQCVDAWRQATMQTEDLVVDQGSKREVVEEVREVLPDVRVAVLAQAFIIEAVDLGDLAGLVVATKDGDALWVSDLERNEEGNSLNREIASINIVACMG
jgi:hypothetical protein